MSRFSRLCTTGTALMLAILAVLAPRVGAQVLDFGKGVGFPGDVVTVPAVFHSQRAGISALGGDIQFNPKSFALKGCALNSAISDKSLTTNPVGPDRARFIVFGLNQSVLPSGALFSCEFTVLRRASTSALGFATISAADPQGNVVRLTSKPGRIVVLDASEKPRTSRLCNPQTCRIPIASCETSHRCDALNGGAATSCRQDCSRAVLAACDEKEDPPLCR